jgi:hypothetical protein
MSCVPDFHRKPPGKLLKNNHTLKGTQRLLRCAASFVVATVRKEVRITPQDLHALHLAIFEQLNKFLLFIWWNLFGCSTLQNYLSHISFLSLPRYAR